MKNSRGVDTEIKCLRQSKRVRSRNKLGEAGVLPAPPQSANTKTSHPELEDTEHKKNRSRGSPCTTTIGKH